MIEIITNKENNHKIIQDDLNGRIYKEEWKCHVCGCWLDEEEIIWANDSGELNTITGNPYCETCLPEEK